LCKNRQACCYKVLTRQPALKSCKQKISGTLRTKKQNPEELEKKDEIAGQTQVLKSETSNTF